MRTSIAAPIAALLLFFTACSDDGDNGADDNADTTEEPADTDATTGGDVEASEPGDADETSTPEPGENSLTVEGIGPVTIGSTEQELTDAGAVADEWDISCENDGPTETIALLADPLIGQVHALDGKVSAVMILDESVSTDPGGVGVGTPRDEASDAFAAAGFTMTVDESTAETFGVYFWSAEGPDGAFGGSIDPATDAVAAIATPEIPICYGSTPFE